MIHCINMQRHTAEKGFSTCCYAPYSGFAHVAMHRTPILRGNLPYFHHLMFVGWWSQKGYCQQCHHKYQGEDKPLKPLRRYYFSHIKSHSSTIQTSFVHISNIICPHIKYLSSTNQMLVVHTGNVIR